MAEASRIVPSDELLKESFFKCFGKEIAEKAENKALRKAVLINLSFIGPEIPLDIVNAVQRADEPSLDALIDQSRSAKSFDDFPKTIGLPASP